MRKIVLITGRLYTGKSGLAKLLREEFGFALFKTSGALRDVAQERSLASDRMGLQQLGDVLDAETAGRWVYDHVLLLGQKLPVDQSIVVDNVRTPEQLEHFRRDRALEVVHVHLYARAADLETRYEANRLCLSGESYLTYSQLDPIKRPEDVESFKRDADVRINTSRTDDTDTLIRVAARLRLYSPPQVRCVDVIVGGQYGSEGKGHVAAYLAREYDVLVRVGGPNAGHSVSSGSGVYVYHQLPSGARDTTAELLLGPGMTIDVDSLLKEIDDCGVSSERLFIDPRAMIIEQVDKDTEQGIVKTIASTGRGSGAAAARRILGRGDLKTRLARDVPELRDYVGTPGNYRGSTLLRLEKAYRAGKAILLEGTQGSGLSLFHGDYPHVTSRDTNVAGCLSEAGISPSRVGRIMMVVRLTPIRVGNPDGNDGHTSGILKHEVTFHDVALAARLDPDELARNEKTSTTRRPRRVGWFEWEQFRLACALNAPTDIVLTFADYMDAENRNARRFEQLSENTIKFVEELERVAQAPVSLINTRFPRDAEAKLDLRTVIDRRNWSREPDGSAPWM